MAAPSFSTGLFLAAESVASMPESFLARHGRRFGLVTTPLPFEMPYSTVVAVATRAALQDAGVAWLADTLAEATAGWAPLDQA